MKSIGCILKEKKKKATSLGYNSCTELNSFISICHFRNLISR